MTELTDAENRQKSCTSKIAFTEPFMAEQAAERMTKRYPGEPFEGHLCRYAPPDAPHYHVAHATRARREYYR